MLLEPYVRIPSFSEVRGRLMSNSCSLGFSTANVTSMFKNQCNSNAKFRCSFIESFILV